MDEPEQSIAATGTNEPTTQSELFHATDADIFVHSCDNVSFALHITNLDFATGGGILDDILVEDKIYLPESSATLEILFQFLYPLRYPSLENMGFEDLLLLAEAAEKYTVCAAMYACQFRMMDFLLTNAMEILIFAAKHDYPLLIAPLPPILVDTPLSELARILPDRIFVHWSIYRGRWVDAFHTVAKICPDHRCPWWGHFSLHIWKQLDKPSRLSASHLQSLMDSPGTHGGISPNVCCRSAAVQWKEAILNLVSTIPEFSLPKRVRERLLGSSDTYQAADADVVIRSSDDVEFRLHRKNLEFFTGGFPPAETPTDGEIVSLPESSETLRVLFRYVYWQRYPPLECMTFDTLINLAEAAEKYEVYAAMYACQLELRNYLSTNSKALLVFAAKHNHTDLIVRLAPILVDTPLSEVTAILPYHIYAPWSIYREQCLKVLHAAAYLYPVGHGCLWWLHFVADVMQKLKPSDLKSPYLRDVIIPTPFPVHDHRSPASCCINLAHQWYQAISHKINTIPAFSLDDE